MRPVRALAAALPLALVPATADACAVCFGAAGSAMTEAMNAGILALLGFVALVQVGIVALVLRFRARSRQLRERRESLQVIQGGMH